MRGRLRVQSNGGDDDGGLLADGQEIPAYPGIFHLSHRFMKFVN